MSPDPLSVYDTAVDALREGGWAFDVATGVVAVVLRSAFKELRDRVEEAEGFKIPYPGYGDIYAHTDRQVADWLATLEVERDDQS